MPTIDEITKSSLPTLHVFLQHFIGGISPLLQRYQTPSHECNYKGICLRSAYYCGRISKLISSGLQIKNRLGYLYFEKYTLFLECVNIQVCKCAKVLALILFLIIVLHISKHWLWLCPAYIHDYQHSLPVFVDTYLPYAGATQ